jgi:transcriptional regulator with XRE-family HTH domain
MQEVYEKNKKKLQKMLSDVVKQRREKTNKSISLISAEIDMTKSMWADLEKGVKDPQLTTLWRIAEGLEIPLSLIISELESKLENDFSLVE